MSDFTNWPGAGPEPEPEAEGFREEQIVAERQRQVDEKEAKEQASVDKKKELSGNPDWPAGRPDPTPEPPAKTTSKTSSKSTSSTDTGS